MKKHNKIKKIKIVFLAIILIYPMMFFAKTNKNSQQNFGVCEKKEKKIKNDIYPFFYSYDITEFSIKKRKIFATIKTTEYNLVVKDPKHFTPSEQKRIEKSKKFLQTTETTDDINDLSVRINKLYDTIVETNFLYPILEDFLFRTAKKEFYFETMLDKKNKLAGFKLYAKNGETIYYSRYYIPVIYIDPKGKIFLFKKGQPYGKAEQNKKMKKIVKNKKILNFVFNDGIGNRAVDCDKTISKKEMTKILEKELVSF